MFDWNPCQVTADHSGRFNMVNSSLLQDLAHMQNDSLSMNRKHEKKMLITSQKVQHRYQSIRAIESSEVSRSFDGASSCQKR